MIKIIYGVIMGFKKWFIRFTTKPSDFARAYIDGLNELIEFLAASIVAFSGKRPFVSGTKIGKTLFESHFDMESVWFEPLEKDIKNLIAPNIEELKNTADPLLSGRNYLR